MSKPFGEPLERCGCGRSADPHYKDHDGLIWFADGRITTKQFTDAELAAEVHAATLDVYRHKVHGGFTADSLGRMSVLSRFATTPGYGEVKE